MKILFVLLFSISVNALWAQKIELFGGVNRNFFYDRNKENPHYMSSYKSGIGFSTGVALDSLKVDWLVLRFTLQYDKYVGKLEVSDGGLAGSYTTIASVDKSILSFGFFPVNFSICNRLHFNLGLLYSKLISESFNGTSSGRIMGQPNWTYNIQDKYSRYSSTSYWGIQGRIAYDFPISNSIVISPQCLYYLGLSGEFDEFPTETKSMRSYLCLGIKKKFL